MKGWPAAFLLACGLGAQQRPADTVLEAMRDELARSLTLSMPGLEKPYYVEYSVDDGERDSIAATLGGIVSRRHERFRAPEIKVRVGGYEFDNGNYVFSGGAVSGRLPIEDSYEVIRRQLWLDTDAAFKSAVQSISRKRAALRNLTVAEKLPDFGPARPVELLRESRREPFDEAGWEGRVRALSAIFTGYAAVRSSSVEVESVQSVHRFASTEGTRIRIGESGVFLRARAQAQAPDGMLVRDAAMYYALEARAMPVDAELRRGVQAVAERVTELARAPRGEDYSGPILFEGVAAAQLFAQVLGRNLALARRPVMEPGRASSFTPSELEGRQGARVLPEWMDVVDDPTQKEWHGHTLFGSCEVDREGVAPPPLVLVEKGVLKGFLLTRQPVHGGAGSNGRALLPGAGLASTAGISNLFVRATGTTPMAGLKKKLLDICEARGKPYGIVVRKLDFPSTASMDEVRRLLGGQRGGARPVSLPILVYKLYTDGREELIRGVNFRGLNARALKDIVAAGDDETIFDFLDNTSPFALTGAGGEASTACVVAPSVLIDDLELHPLEEELPKLPVAPPPEPARKQP